MDVILVSGLAGQAGMGACLHGVCMVTQWSVRFLPKDFPPSAGQKRSREHSEIEIVSKRRRGAVNPNNILAEHVTH